jgi:predicted permease
MDTFVRNLKQGVRALFKNPGVSAIAILALTLGIGANTAIFSVINAVLLRPLPYPNPDRLVLLWEQSAKFDKMSISYLNFVDWREQTSTLEELAATRNRGFNLTGSAEPERLRGREVSWNFFQALGITPALGRGFLREEDTPGGSPVAVISHGLWARRFGSDPGLIGRALSLAGKNYTVVGVLPPDFYLLGRPDVFVTIENSGDPLLQEREMRGGTTAIGRLKEGASVEQARADLLMIASRLAEKYPVANEGQGVVIESMYESVVQSVRPALLVLFGAVGVVLLIACSNVANLLLAQATSRQKEIAIRLALGASRARIAAQLLTESVLLSVIGGGLGLLLAMWGTDALVAAMPGAIPRAEGIRVSSGVLLFTFAVAVLTGVAFGLVPALLASKTELNETLKDKARGLIGGRHRLRSALVVIEVALALVLLIGAGLMIRTMAALRNVDTGMVIENVLTIDLPLNNHIYSKPDQIRAFHRRILERVSAAPGIEAVAFNTDMPLSGDDSELPFWLGIGERPPLSEMTWALLYPVTSGYAQAMGIPLKRGRFITEQDSETTARVAVVDELLAEGVFPGEDPIGKRLTVPPIAGIPEFQLEIVGVVGHAKHWGLDTDSQAKIQYQLYLAQPQVPDPFVGALASNITLVARTRSEPLSMVEEVKRQIAMVDKDQPVSNVRTMKEIVAGTMARRNFALLLLSIFAGVAMVLATTGIYGVMSYMVTQRTHEMGIRMALGATSGGVVRLVAGNGLKLSVIGVGIGLVAAYAVTRVMSELSGLLFGVSPTDPATFGVIATLLIIVALAACYVPALRASKVDPMVALRYE